MTGFSFAKPWSLTTEADRSKARESSRVSSIDLSSSFEHKRLKEMYDDMQAVSLAFVEAVIVDDAEALRQKLASPGKANSADQPVLVSQATFASLKHLLAHLWYTGSVVRDFNREQRQLLEERVAKLEARPVFEDAGVWDRDKSYLAGQGVTSDGSFWICKRPSAPGERPGASDAFRLAVKRGKDARQ